MFDTSHRDTHPSISPHDTSDWTWPLIDRFASHNTSCQNVESRAVNAWDNRDRIRGPFPPGFGDLRLHNPRDRSTRNPSVGVAPCIPAEVAAANETQKQNRVVVAAPVVYRATCNCFNIKKVGKTTILVAVGGVLSERVWFLPLRLLTVELKTPCHRTPEKKRQMPAWQSWFKSAAG